MYILREDNENGDHSDEISEIKDTVEKGGGEVENIDEWGVRTLAYEINKQKEGYYVLVEFSYESSQLFELEEKWKLADNVLRHLVVRKD